MMVLGICSQNEFVYFIFMILILKLLEVKIIQQEHNSNSMKKNNNNSYLFQETNNSFDQQEFGAPNLKSKYKPILSRIVQKQLTPVHLQIELDNGKTQTITPKMTDNPLILATDFCFKHNLDSKMVQILAKGIKSTILKISNNYKANKERKNILTEPNQKVLKQQHQNYRSQKKNNYENYQLDLYQRAVREKHSKQSWIQHQKINKLREELKQCTYSPRINLVSKQIAVQKYKRHKNSINQSQKSLSVHSRYSSINNQKSQQQKDKSVFEFLYEDNHIRQVKKSKQIVKMNKQMNFKPKINPSSKRMVGSVSFQERLQKYNSIKQKKLKTLTAQAQKTFSKKQDTNDKQCEQINRALRDLPDKNSYSYKLSQSKSKRQSIKQKQKKSISPFQKQQKQNISHKKRQFEQQLENKHIKKNIINYNHNHNPTALKNSDLIYNDRKYKIFTAIFHILDDDQDLKISITNINLMRIEPELMRILFPLLQQLQIMDIQLTKSDFVTALDNLFKGLSPIDKNYLLCLNSTKIEQMRPTFQPQLNQLSRRIVQNTQRQQMTIYEYSIIKQNNIKKQVQKQRISKQKQTMKQCTFHPKINKKRIFY